jgi:hypothetical protein
LSEVRIMKSLVCVAVAVAGLAASAVSLAQQSGAPETRAQTRAELQQIEQAGYRPGGEDPSYPSDIQAAEARVSAQGDTAYGPSVAGTSQSGSAAVMRPQANDGTKPIFFGQ